MNDRKRKAILDLNKRILSESSRPKGLKESVNQQAKEDLKEQFYQLEALSRLDPWDVVNVLEELRREYNQY